MTSFSLHTKIWIAVTFIHLVGLAFLSVATPPKPKVKKMQVVTKYAVRSSPTLAVATSQAKSPVKAVITPIKKPPLTKPQKKIPKSSPKTKTKPKHASPKQMLKKLDQHVAKPYTPPVENVEIATPNAIDLAAAFFRETLLLPEKGSVKLTITVQPNGKIDKIGIETFESKQNLDYLMAMLPTLSLPISEGVRHAETFTVLFCND